VEDQGWVAWFIIAAVTGRPIKVFGDGKQVRDILFVDDLINAYEIAINQPKLIAGQIFNIGGGAENTVSIYLEFFPILEKLLGKKIQVTWGDWRPGDQKVYVSDIQKAGKILKWKPNIDVSEGIKRLYEWVKLNAKYF
jgi:CDP-paratose 2-epimerase